MGVTPPASTRSRLRAWIRPRLPAAAAFAICALAAMVIAAPVVVERAVEDVHISDQVVNPSMRRNIVVKAATFS